MQQILDIFDKADDDEEEVGFIQLCGLACEADRVGRFDSPGVAETTWPFRASRCQERRTAGQVPRRPFKVSVCFTLL